jgi:hypothetical protein
MMDVQEEKMDAAEIQEWLKGLRLKREVMSRKQWTC